MKLTIPAYVRGLHPEVEQLMRKFGNCRRRAYNMKRKDVDRLSIIRQLREESGILARYVSAAYDTIKALPSHVTFGGLELQRLRETGKKTNLARTGRDNRRSGAKVEELDQHRWLQVKPQSSSSSRCPSSIKSLAVFALGAASLLHDQTSGACARPVMVRTNNSRPYNMIPRTGSAVIARRAFRSTSHTAWTPRLLPCEHRYRK